MLVEHASNCKRACCPTVRVPRHRYREDQRIVIALIGPS